MKDASLKDRSRRLFAGTRAQLAAFAEAADVPVLAGPWLGEVGFELLYWLPFLRWAVGEFPGLRNQIVVVSRGGVDSWYEGIYQHYFDLFDYFTLKEVRKRFPKFLKQASSYDDYVRRKYGDAEGGLIERVRRELGVPRVNVLHPSVMYESFKFILDLEEMGMTVHYPRFTPPPLGSVEGMLPERFVAARFYQCFPFPATGVNRDFVQTLVSALADEIPVVLLNTGMAIDRKHPDFSLDASPNVLSLEGHMSLRNNLAVQSAIISRAIAFIGVYGGLSYLSPHYGKPSYSLCSDLNSLLKTGHSALAHRALAAPNLGGYWVGSVHDMTPRAVAEKVLASTAR